MGVPPAGVVVAATKPHRRSICSPKNRFCSMALVTERVRYIGRKLKKVFRCESRVTQEKSSISDGERINSSNMKKRSSLHALRAVALTLPGLAQATDGDPSTFTFQYGRYEEGKRELFDTKNDEFDPIVVDSIFGNVSLNFLDRFKFSGNYTQDTWSGATPITTAPLQFMFDTPTGASSFAATNVFVDADFDPVDTSVFTPSGLLKDTQLVHMVTSASVETRKQGDFGLTYEWDEAAATVGGGLSSESDYESHFVNIGGSLDFNSKLTTVDFGMSYTWSDIDVNLDPRFDPYIDEGNHGDDVEISIVDGNRVTSVTGKRRDWSANLGLTQVLNKNALIESSIGYTRSSGFLENAYKVVGFLFVEPMPGMPFLSGNFDGVLEQRPDVRNQWVWDNRLVHYVEPLDASVHADYRLYHDDWGITAHTLELDWNQPLGRGWTVIPRVRYYSQNEADFYQPFFLFKQAKPLLTPGRPDIDFSQVPISEYSSDHRLSGFGTLSGGITIAKQIGDAVSLKAGFEYYTHQGGLKLGGGGEDDFADFDYWAANASLTVDLSAKFLPVLSSSSNDHFGLHRHRGHSGGHAPAGVMFSHMLPSAGDFMVGYRYMRSERHGDILHGTGSVSDATIISQGCGNVQCSFAPRQMIMNMHMLDIMYAPTDWLNLVLMPQFVDMEMDLRPLPGQSLDVGEHQHGGNSTHETGGVGDTGLYALIKLFETPGHHLHMALGGTAPTGDVAQTSIREEHPPLGAAGTVEEFVHYGMQNGSGTWDFRPSLTYTGQGGAFSWGGQLSGIIRLDHRNDSGFAFGDEFKSTLWTSYNLFSWLSASVRMVYTRQGEIRGEYDGPHSEIGPMDFPESYGGEYWDLGLGLSSMIPFSGFEGNRLAFEWIQPLNDDVNGFQLEREGSLIASWSISY